MRFLGRLILGLLFFFLCAGAVFAAIGWQAHDLPTIWLPFALAAVVIALLLAVPLDARLRCLVGCAVGAGVLLLWLFSEPMVSFPARLDLKVAAGVFGAVGGCSELWLLRKGLTGARADRALYRWCAGLVLMSWQIAYFSSPSGSAGGMLTMAENVLHLSPDQAETAVFCLRKSIHFSFYGLLGWTAFRLSLASGGRLWPSLLFGLALALAFACFDEGRQTFFPDRTASILDVVLDSCGALFFASLSGFRRMTRNVAAG